jgi:hypothetical protein
VLNDCTYQTTTLCVHCAHTYRYILQPPSECKHLHLYPRGHPSARHSDVDWSNIEQVSIKSTTVFATLLCLVQASYSAHPLPLTPKFCMA